MRNVEQDAVIPGTVDHLPVLAVLGQRFYEEGRLPGRFIPGTFCRTWEQLLQTGAGGLFLLPDGGLPVGAIGGVLYPDPNDGALVATECFWFVHPQFRGRGLELLEAFESWARDRGAQRIIMVLLHNLMPEQLSALYRRRGYTAVETHYVKGME
jgi:GNAT superfamily N-acetyltransferase